MQHRLDPSSLGPHGPAMVTAVQSCVHCGFCLAACPTYRVLGQEMDSPRGRIVLMKQVLEGTLPAEEAQPHIDACLGCLACEPACPSGVPYRDLISPYRARTEQNRRRPFFTRFRRWLVAQTLPYPERFRWAARLGRLGKVFQRWLPPALRPMLELLPAQLPDRVRLPAFTPPQGVRRGRVALLAGCAQQVLAPEIAQAAIAVLARNGIEVVVPSGQACCGALAWHTGDLATAQTLARTNLRAFPTDVDAILTTAAGCGSGLHEYHQILAGTPQAEAAEAFRHRVCDITAFLARLDSLAPFPAPQPIRRVAYQDACHLANAQEVREEPRALLKAIPGLELVEIADAHLCCGSAGTYNLDQPAIAAQLGRAKAQAIVQSGADLVASGNIGCLTQLRAFLPPQIAARHTVEILWDAYRATPG